MKSQLHSWFPSSLIIVTLLIPFAESQANSSRLHESISYDTCSASFTCKTISGIQYPFSRREDPIHCGYPGFELDCNGSNSPTIDINNMTYHVLSIDQSSQILKIVREDVMESICPHDFVNTTIDEHLFDHSSMYTNLTFLYGCPDSFNLPGVHLNPFSCDDNGIDEVLVLPGEQGPGVCKESVIIPVPGTAIGSTGLVNSSGLSQVLRGGFEVRWKLDSTACSQCTESGGRCFYNYDTNRTSCACPGSELITDICTMANTTRAGSSPKERSLTIALPIAGGILATIGIGFGLFVCRQRKKRQANETTQKKESVTAVSIKGLVTDFPANIIPYTSSTTTEFGNSSYFGTQVFTYNELEAATDGFDDSRELGDGGFGTVYYGKLVDGLEVAVKRLYENSFKRVEQFMNEVEILTMLDHENLVKFYGCTSRRSRELLLVYEYIPNGTVADHLHGKLANPNSNPSSPNWPLRLNIAIETAEALAYLHDSDIIHRDVKTSNILLDNNFGVKVADFGLSRLFPLNVTHVSTAPQGTPGYVDPEYYLCYRLTDKSDVYSFGVVLMELLSSLQAVDTSRHRLDINLANMAMDRIQNRRLGELVDKRIGFENDGSVRRMVTLVAELGFRCLQHEKDMRPTMREVVENLRGIRNEELNVQKPEVVDIVVDDGGNPPSSDSGATGDVVESQGEPVIGFNLAIS